MAAERVQKAHDAGTLDVSATEGQEPSQALTRARGEHRANPREPLPVERFTQAGRLAFGGPSGPDRGALQGTRSRPETPAKPPAGGFLLAWGQRTRTQRAITASSHSWARRAGRCRLHPSARRTRQTCRRWWRRWQVFQITRVTHCKVHRGVGKPHATGPFNRAASRRSRAAASKRGLQPARPWRGQARYQRCAVGRLTLRRRTISACGWPRVNNLAASIRRASRSAKSRRGRSLPSMPPGLPERPRNC